jgi:hypothetical protein
MAVVSGMEFKNPLNLKHLLTILQYNDLKNRTDTLENNIKTRSLGTLIQTDADKVFNYYDYNYMDLIYEKERMK